MFGITYTPEEEAFRAELRAWLEANLPRAPAPEEEGERRRFQRAWQRALAAGGWVGIQWPRAHGGRGASLREQIIFTEEMARVRAPEILDPVSVNIVGPILVRFGTPAQQPRSRTSGPRSGPSTSRSACRTARARSPTSTGAAARGGAPTWPPSARGSRRPGSRRRCSARTRCASCRGSMPRPTRPPRPRSKLFGSESQQRTLA